MNFSLKSGTGQGQFAHVVLFDIILKILAYTVKQIKEIKRYRKGREK
jgi:hypothetical protein